MIFRANDGTEFSTQEECETYERRIKFLLKEFIKVGLVDQQPGLWIANKLNVCREFLVNIELLDDTLQIVQRLEGAHHLAYNMESYIQLGKWLERVSRAHSIDPTIPPDPCQLEPPLG